MQMPSSRWWWDLSTKEFSELEMDKVVAILPIAATEQHGPHLPVRVDAAINEGIVNRAAELMPDDLPALILPMLPIGKSDEHLAFPGTLTLSYQTLGQMWFEIAQCVHRAGVRKILFWNSHGGQPQLMDIVCRRLRVELEMFAVGANWFSTIDSSDLYNKEERTHGIHGGESETGMLLHLHPELVRMEHAEHFHSISETIAEQQGILTPEGGVGFGWQAQDLNPSGVCGNAAAADAERGREELERSAKALVKLAREVSEYPLSRLAKPRYACPAH